MRIKVKSGNIKINIPIPTGLIFSKASAWLWLKTMRLTAKPCVSQYMPDSISGKPDACLDSLSDEAVYALCAELMRIKRKYGSWDLVEVESSDGSQVLIRL